MAINELVLVWYGTDGKTWLHLLGAVNGFECEVVLACYSKIGCLDIACSPCRNGEDIELQVIAAFALEQHIALEG